MSLKEVQEYAAQENHQVRISEKETEKARKDVQATAAIGLPQVRATGSYENFIDRPTNLIPAEFFGGPPGEFAEVQFGTEHNATYRIEGEQLIFDGSYFVGLQASRTYKEMSQKQLEKNRQEIRKRIADAYINTLLTQENRKILERTLENIRGIFEDTDALFEEGMTDQEERDRLERSVLNMENSVRNAKEQEGRIKRSLKLLAGLPVKDSLVLEDSLQGILEDGESAELLGDPFHPEEHIEHQIASTQVQLEELDHKNQKADFLPEFSAFFNYQENAQRDEFNIFDADGVWYPQTVAGVRVSMPIFNSGRKLFQAQKAKLDRVQAEIERDRVDAELRTSYEDAKAEYIQNKKQLENHRRTMELSRNILESTISRHREGTASSSEVTRTKNEYLEDRTTYLRSVKDLLEARTELKKILGYYR